MTTTKPTTGWSKGFPKADGMYWTRLVGDVDVTLVRIEARVVHEFGVAINFGEPDYEDCEWLGPITPSDFQQLAALRKAATNALTWIDEITLGKPLTKQGNVITAALRNALGPVSGD